MLRALELTRSWPVGHASAAVLIAAAGGAGAGADVHTVGAEVHTVGDVDHVMRIASLTKVLVGWTAMIAVEEGIVALDDPAGQPGCTVRHLLSHAGGYGFDGPDPITRPGARRTYSNTGIEIVAEVIAAAAAMPFEQYLREAVLGPLAMTSSELRGSPAHGLWSTTRDMTALIAELMAPTLVSRQTAVHATAPAFPELGGVIPGLGRYDPCPWGLGIEVRGTKTPHWTGTRNSPATFGHFGGSGTFLWVDPGAAGGRAVGCVALTDRPFDEWAADALVLWPQLSDEILAEAADR